MKKLYTGLLLFCLTINCSVQCLEPASEPWSDNKKKALISGLVATGCVVGSWLCFRKVRQLDNDDISISYCNSQKKRG